MSKSLARVISIMPITEKMISAGYSARYTPPFFPRYPGENNNVARPIVIYIKSKNAENRFIFNIPPNSRPEDPVSFKITVPAATIPRVAIDKLILVFEIFIISSDKTHIAVNVKIISGTIPAKSDEVIN